MTAAQMLIVVLVIIAVASLSGAVVLATSKVIQWDNNVFYFSFLAICILTAVMLANWAVQL